MGFEIAASHHEVAPGQHEIDLVPSNALRIADRIATFKFVTKAIAVMLKAGLNGIRNKIKPSIEFIDNIYNTSDTRIKGSSFKNLPGSIDEATSKLVKDKVICDILGKHILTHFLQAKKIETKIYKTQVHQWELEQYLKNY